VRLAVDDLKIMIQLAKEIKAFKNFQQFQVVSELVVLIGKQGGAWCRQLTQRIAPGHPGNPDSQAPHGNSSAPASQAREYHEIRGGMSQNRDAAHPGCIPKRRMGTRAIGTGATKAPPNLQSNPRLVVSKVIVRQQGYLKRGLRRRCIESITFFPLSQTGVSLCASFAP
jgi:hypothetical protein